jgi:DNA-directed RNA polymerase subunit M/transcription elongation factor TFIIS
MAQIVGSEFVCSACGHSFKNAKGLQGHMRLSHNKPTINDNYKVYVDDALERMMSLLEKQNESIIKLQGGVSEIVCKDCGQFLGRNASDVEELKSCPKCGGTHAKTIRDSWDAEKRLTVLGRLIESIGNGLIKSNGEIAWCEDDIKGLKYIGVKPNEFTLNHVREVKK